MYKQCSRIIDKNKKQNTDKNEQTNGCLKILSCEILSRIKFDFRRLSGSGSRWILTIRMICKLEN